MKLVSTCTCTPRTFLGAPAFEILSSHSLGYVLCSAMGWAPDRTAIWSPGVPLHAAPVRIMLQETNAILPIAALTRSALQRAQRPAGQRV